MNFRYQKTILIGAFFFLCAALMPITAKDYTPVCKKILDKKLTHPYLVFTNESKKAILDRVKTDPVYAQMMDRLMQEGRRIMLNTTEPERVSNDIASRYNQTPLYENYIWFYLGNAQLLAFLYQMTGDEAYAQKAFRYVDKLCALENWAAGAHHFEIIYPRVWPYGAKDDEVVFSYDIMTGDCALGLGLIYDWIYPTLNREQRDRIRGGLLENAITRVRGNYEYHWWAEAYKCNWSAICHGGLGMAALSLLTEDPHLIDVVARSCDGMEKMLANYGEDNGWAEGRHYAVYGIRESIAFADAMKSLTKGEVNLFNAPGLKHPADFALFGMTGTFNDGFSPGPVGYSYMYNKLISEVKDPTAMYYLETYLSNDARSMNMWELIWPRPTDVKAVKPAVASKYFASVDWAFMRTDIDDDNVQVALKCAPADDPHHGHLDAGTINVTWKDDIIVGEVEQRFYDQFFFNDVRFDYLYVRSLGHNVVLVNDEEQVIQKRKNQPWQPGFGGKIDKFVTTPDFDYTVMDPTKAYAGKQLKGWKRTVILDKKNNTVVVLDKVNSAKGAKIDVLFHPSGPMTTTVNDDKSVSIEGKKASMEMRPLVNASYDVRKEWQYTVRVVKTDPVQKVPCLFTTLKAPAEKTVIGTVFYPADMKSTATKFTLDESGKNPVIRYTLGGTNYAWEISENDVKKL